MCNLAFKNFFRNFNTILWHEGVVMVMGQTSRHVFAISVAMPGDRSAPSMLLMITSHRLNIANNS
jgi:hypothetical protein